MIRIFFPPKIIQFNIPLSYNFSKTHKKSNNFMGQNDKWMGQNDKWMRQNDKWMGQKMGQNDNEIASAHIFQHLQNLSPFRLILGWSHFHKTNSLWRRFLLT